MTRGDVTLDSFKWYKFRCFVGPMLLGTLLIYVLVGNLRYDDDACYL